MNALVITFSSITCLMISTNAVPPSPCFANFRWDDCGREPEPKMYYWKPGSRCEVGIWRGCLPSLNMFKDEYECVSTCIFSVRAQPIDYHNKQALDGDYGAVDDSQETTTVDDIDVTTSFGNTTGTEDDVTGDNSNSTDVDEATTLSLDTDETPSESNNANEGENSESPGNDGTTTENAIIDTTEDPNQGNAD